jgi:hypothetical protein
MRINSRTDERNGGEKKKERKKEGKKGGRKERRKERKTSTSVLGKGTAFIFPLFPMRKSIFTDL